MSTKERLDVALVARGLAETRAKAQASIMSGIVYVNGQKVDKAGTPVAADAALEVRGHTLRYVSRGGLKLEKAMAAFPITLTDCICADIGASTGGFTDCMLQNGAKKVYAVDVGYGQLDWRLRSDARVVCMERTNARYLTHEQIPDDAGFRVRGRVVHLAQAHSARARGASEAGRATPSAWSSRSSRQDGKRSAKRASCAIPPCIWRCSSTFWSTQRKVALPSLA